MTQPTWYYGLMAELTRWVTLIDSKDPKFFPEIPNTDRKQMRAKLREIIPQLSAAKYKVCRNGADRFQIYLGRSRSSEILVAEADSLRKRLVDQFGMFAGPDAVMASVYERPWDEVQETLMRFVIFIGTEDPSMYPNVPEFERKLLASQLREFLPSLSAAEFKVCRKGTEHLLTKLKYTSSSEELYDLADDLRLRLADQFGMFSGPDTIESKTEVTMTFSMVLSGLRRHAVAFLMR